MKVRSFFYKIAITIFWVLCTLIFLHLPEFFTSQSKKSISILVWPNILNKDVFALFEKETGIKVYITYFENYEELFVKLRTGGSQGYDVIMTSDYIGELLIQKDLLAPLDKEKCSFIDRIDPQYLGLYFDKNNTYTLPVAFSIYGLGIDTSSFNKKCIEPTWGLLFDENITPGHIGVPDDARELVLIAAYYLFGSIENLDDNKLEKIVTLLKKQKKWVELYGDLRTDYLLFSQTSPVVAAMHPDLAHAVNTSKNIRFVIPKEGAFGVLDSFAIAKKSSHKDFAYTFLNFLYRKEIMNYYVNRYKFISPLNDVEWPNIGLSKPKDLFIHTIHFFKNVLSAQKLGEMWIKIKG